MALYLVKYAAWVLLNNIFQIMHYVGRLFVLYSKSHCLLHFTCRRHATSMAIFFFITLKSLINKAVLYTQNSHLTSFHVSGMKNARKFEDSFGTVTVADILIRFLRAACRFQNLKYGPVASYDQCDQKNIAKCL